MRTFLRLLCYASSSFLLLFLSACFISDEVPYQQGNQVEDKTITIPTGGNSWVVNQPERNDDMIIGQGIRNWNDGESRIQTFFRLEQAGVLSLSLRGRVSAGPSVVQAFFAGESVEVRLANTQTDRMYIGDFVVSRPGYYALELQGVSKTGESYAEVDAIILGGAAAGGEVHFVRDEFYWGRRGPSCHLWYQRPAAVDEVAWFYSEITVPEGQDIEGSYFMANGFSEGYFGFQVNSPTERRILFSVWSPYQTDDPAQIPEDYKIRLLKKGSDVYTGEFGNEGSGGQSYLRYDWQAGTTYGFLLRGEPTGAGATDYTAWFFPPEVGEWLLIASWRRPKTDTYLTGLYSFLENFLTETGATTRRALYGNQWVCDTAGQWYELTGIRFTADATARKGNRLDYTGGLEDGRFFLKNCGFFSERTNIGTEFQRPAMGIPPQIDFSTLP